MSAWSPSAVPPALAFIPHTPNALSHANMTLGKLSSLWNTNSPGRERVQKGMNEWILLKALVLRCRQARTQGP